MEPEKKKRNSRLTILLSINAAAIVLAGTLIAGAIFFNDDSKFRAVDERTDEIGKTVSETELIDSASDSSATSPEQIDVIGNDDYISTSSHEFDSSPVPAGELWNEESIVIYGTPDIDICIGGGLSDLGDTYWQTSDTNVISGFYNSARSWLGYDSNTCRYPVIKDFGTTRVTAGTYDGLRKDSILVTVMPPPEDQWKHEVLTLVNKIRVRNNLPQLSWGETCAEAANIRAKEAMSLYSHTRPDGSSWSSVCPAPTSGGVSGENLAIGNAAVSPASVVALWMGSEAHRANILNPEFTKLSVGFIFDINSEHKTYWSQFFSTY